SRVDTELCLWNSSAITASSSLSSHIIKGEDVVSGDEKRVLGTEMFLSVGSSSGYKVKIDSILLCDVTGVVGES
ncbi:3926_t:CDS:2, partial [Diversispora eburnea]